MGDGSRHKELGLKLHTDSFSPQDIAKLINCLLLKFNDAGGDDYLANSLMSCISKICFG